MNGRLKCTAGKFNKRGLLGIYLMCLCLTFESQAHQSIDAYDLPGNLTTGTGTNAVAPSITTQPQSALLYSKKSVSLCVVAAIHRNQTKCETTC